MRFFDTHAHIGLIDEDPIEQLILAKEAKQEKVEALVTISNSLSDFDPIYENLKSLPYVYFAAGVAPSEVEHPGKDWELKIERCTKLERVIAVGETGLDYYRKFGDKSSQIELFIRQLEIASRLNLPVIIHNREAGKDVVDILKDRLPSKGGIFHCYSENWEYAQKCLDMNIYFSFAGNITYKNARNLHETALNLPLDRILIETESPFMVPTEYRGRRNKPAYIHSIVGFLAELREMPVEEIAEILFQNSMRVFGLKDL